MKNLMGAALRIESVGVRKGGADAFAAAVMQEIGVDMSAHRPKTFDELSDEAFDLVISLSPEAQHKAVELTRSSNCQVEFWHTMDPSIVDGSRDMRMVAYRAIRDQLRDKLRQRFLARPPVV